MSTQVIHPPNLSIVELDGYLARGWYRIGRTMMTCRYYIADDDVYSTIWTRLPTEEFTFRRGLRRLMARNGRKFTTTVGRVRLDEVREGLYKRYLTAARGERSPTLESFLGGDDGKRLFDTWEIGVWHGERMVALSLFDPAAESLQSLLGAYDPEYKSDSLGFYTMLLEVQYCMDAGLKYHYSGYVVPGQPFMDYKWRVGDEMQFRDPDTGLWRPSDQLDAVEDPADRLRDALYAAKRALRERGVPTVMRVNEMFEARHLDPVLSAALDQPLALECYPDRGKTRLFVTWDFELNAWMLQRCVRVEGRLVPADGDEGRSRSVTYWIVVGRLGVAHDPGQIADEVLTRTTHA